MNDLGPASLGDAPADQAPDAGFSLIEVLVAITLFGLLSTMLLGFALSTSAVSRSVDDAGGLTGESRLALERLSRELRQAREIKAVTLPPSGSPGSTAITLWTDFNNNGTEDLGAADPEVLTYRWEPGSRQLTLTANDASGTAVSRPVLAGEVTGFTLLLRSSLWQHDGADGSAPDGTVSWQELDRSSIGNNDGTPSGELDRVDLVALSMTVSAGGVSQRFDLQADLRNRVQK